MLDLFAELTVRMEIFAIEQKGNNLLGTNITFFVIHFYKTRKSLEKI